MKKSIKKISIILLIISIGLGVIIYLANKPRNPIRVLKTSLREDFGINSKILHPVVTHFHEQWCLNGNGEMLVKFNYSASMSDIQHILPEMKVLPGSEPKMQLLESEYSPTGYYMYKERSLSFKVFILDTLNKKGVLYVFLN